MYVFLLNKRTKSSQEKRYRSCLFQLGSDVVQVTVNLYPLYSEKKITTTMYNDIIVVACTEMLTFSGEKFTYAQGE